MAPIVQEPEIVFAQRLASNEKSVRTKAIKKLRKYISLRSQKIQGGFTEVELLKIWKGLFYCLWMQDKPILQEELSGQISGLIHSFQSVDSQHLFMETFLHTVKREWNGIDIFRLDKFFQLVRFVFRQAFEMLKRRKWETSVVSRFLELFSGQLLLSCSSAPSGLMLHILDLYMTELAWIGSDQLTAEQNLSFIEPFCKSMAKTKDRVLLKSISTNIFSAIVEQAPFAIEELMKEVRKAAGEESASGQASEEKEEEEEQPKSKTPSKSSKKAKGKPTNGTTESEEDEDDEDEEDDYLLDMEPEEMPEDEGVGPVLQFDYAAVADRLFELASRANTPSFNRNKIYKLVKTLRDLSEGVFPQDEFPEEVSTDEDDDELFGSRKRIKKKRRRNGEQDEDQETPAKKRKGKKGAEKAGKPTQTSTTAQTEQAEAPSKQKKKQKKKKGAVKRGEEQRVTEESSSSPALPQVSDAPPPAEPAGPSPLADAPDAESQLETLLADGPSTSQPEMPTTDAKSQSETPTTDARSQSETLTKPPIQSEASTEPQSQSEASTEPQSQSEAAANAVSTKKKRRSKKLKPTAEAGSETQPQTEPEVTCSDVEPADASCADEQPADEQGAEAKGDTQAQAEVVCTDVEPANAGYAEVSIPTPLKKKKNQKKPKVVVEETAVEEGELTCADTETNETPAEESCCAGEQPADVSAATPLKKKKNSKKLKTEQADKQGAEAGIETQPQTEPEVVCVDVEPADASCTDERPADISIDAQLNNNNKKQKVTQADEQGTEVEGDSQTEAEVDCADAAPAVTEEKPADAGGPVPLKRKKKNLKKQKAARAEQPTAEVNGEAQMQAQASDVSVATPLKKKKKQKAVRPEEPSADAQTDCSAAVAPLKKGKKKRKMEGEESIQINGHVEEETGCKKAKICNPEEVSAPLSAKKKKKKKKQQQQQQQPAATSPGSDFVTFQSRASVPIPLFCKTKAKGSPGTPLSSKQMCQTPKSEAKKVTFGLKNNKTAEFRKTDRSLLVSPVGSSRVAFDPKKTPKFGVLKSPVASPASSGKKTKSAKGRPTAADFF